MPLGQLRHHFGATKCQSVISININRHQKCLVVHAGEDQASKQSLLVILYARKCLKAILSACLFFGTARTVVRDVKSTISRANTTIVGLIIGLKIIDEAQMCRQAEYAVNHYRSSSVMMKRSSCPMSALAMECVACVSVELTAPLLDITTGISITSSLEHLGSQSTNT